MRRMVKFAAGVAVLLASAACGGEPGSGASAPAAPAGPPDRLRGVHATTVGVAADSTRLLAHEGA